MYTQIRLAYRFALLIVAFFWAFDGLAATKEDDKQLASLTAGRELLDAHKPAQAISQHFDKVIQHYEARFAKSKTRIYCARTPEEIIYYAALAAGNGEDADILDSTWSDAYFLKAYSLVELEHPAEAARLLERARELSPMNSAYLSESAHLDQMNKDWEGALAKFVLATEAAETYTPDEAKVFEWTRALRGQGFALVELDRLEEAKGMYRKALELDPDDEGSKGELRYIERMQANLTAESEPFVEDPKWVIGARVAFVEKETLTARPRMSQGDFKLWFPWIGGDLYGAPTTNDFIAPVVSPDYAFTIDLNKSRQHLIRSLDVARFDNMNLSVEPADARIARVATFAVRPDMSASVGTTVWRDGSEAGDHYVLVYFDRACRVTGTIQVQQINVERKYDVVVPSAGYYWLRSKKIDESHQEMTVGEKPADLILAIEPLDD